MSEIFQFSAQSQRVPTGSAYPDIRNMDWQPSGVDGFWIKPLLSGTGDGVETWLMKVDAGAYSESHAHEKWEQVYVIEGTLYDQNRVLNAGDFACRAPGAPHTAGSDDGALVLLVYSAATHA